MDELKRFCLEYEAELESSLDHLIVTPTNTTTEDKRERLLQEMAKVTAKLVAVKKILYKIYCEERGLNYD